MSFAKYIISLFQRRNWLGKRNWHFHIKEENGQIVASGQGYSNLSDCERTVDNLKANLSKAEIHYG